METTNGDDTVITARGNNTDDETVITKAEGVTNEELLTAEKKGRATMIIQMLPFPSSLISLIRHEAYSNTTNPLIPRILTNSETFSMVQEIFKYLDNIGYIELKTKDLSDDNFKEVLTTQRPFSIVLDKGRKNLAVDQASSNEQVSNLQFRLRGFDVDKLLLGLYVIGTKDVNSETTHEPTEVVTFKYINRNKRYTSIQMQWQDAVDFTEMLETLIDF